MVPKVLVGCPTADLKEYCLVPYVERLKELTYENFDILLVDNSLTKEYSKKIIALGIPCIKLPREGTIPENVIRGRNYLREYMLENKYDYFLSLEQDVIPQKNIIELLLEAQKDVVSGVAPHLLLRNGKSVEIALLGIDDPQHPGIYIFFTYESAKKKEGVVSVDYCAMACVLLSRKILEKITFRYETKHSLNELDVIWDDICFCRDAKEKLFLIYANLAARCEHLYGGGFSATFGDTSRLQKVKNEK